jgi:hypothetical protein
MRKLSLALLACATCFGQTWTGRLVDAGGAPPWSGDTGTIRAQRIEIP